MRILYGIHQFYPQFVSGTEQYVLALARAGRARGDDVRVFTVDPDFRNVDPPVETAAYDFDGVPVVRHRFDKAAIRNHVLTDYHNPDVGPAFEAVLDRFAPELVHFFHFRWLGLDRLQEVRRRGIPAVVHLMDFWFVCPNFLLWHADGHLCDGPPDGGLGCFDCVHQGIAPWAREPWARGQQGRWEAAGEPPRHDASGAAAGYAMAQRPRILRAALEEADLVIAPSATVAGMLALNGVSPPRLVFAPYGIEWERLAQLAPPPRRPVTFGFVGTLAPHKGVDVLLEAFTGLAGPLRLRIHGRLGDFPDFDRRLQERCAGDPRVEWCGGFARDQLAAVLSGLHVLVVPSVWRENTPFVCLEGRAAGLAVVVSDLPGMVEAVPEGRGRTFRAGDAADLRRVLGEVAAEVERRDGRRLEPDRSLASVGEQYEDFRARYLALVEAAARFPGGTRS